MIEVKQIDREVITSLVNSLENFEKDKAIKEGLNSAGNTLKSGGISRLRQRMKSGSKGVTGNLQRSIIVKPKRNKPGVLTGFKRGEGGGNHAHLVDRGTKKRPHPLTGNSGIMPANHFWIDTEMQDGDKAINKVYEGVERAVERMKSRR